MRKVKSKTITPAQQSTEIDALIQKGLESNASVETMERLFALYEKVKADKAKTEYVRSLSTFQDSCPVITKTKKVLNKDGRSVRYMYAPLDSIVEQIRKPLENNGLSYTWDVKNDENMITAIAKVTHIMGHSETSSFSVPIDSNQYMTSPQRYASALTFAKRYSLCNALGISTADEDTDAVDVEGGADAKSPKAQIMLRLRALGQKTESREDIEEAVKNLTGVELKEEHYTEIADKLGILVAEKQEYEDSQIQ